MTATRPDGTALLRSRRLRVTDQRLAVLAAVADLWHPTAEEVHRHVSAALGQTSRQTVYDALGAICDQGLLRRIQPAGSPTRYEDRVGDNHHHLICRTCGRTVDVDCAVGDTPCLQAADDSGFEIDEAEVVYWGHCPACLAAGRAPAPTDGRTGPVAAGPTPPAPPSPAPPSPAPPPTPDHMEDPHV